VSRSAGTSRPSATPAPSLPPHDAVELTIERLEDGEISPYLVDEVIAGDQFEVRGPIGGPFTWSVDEGGPLYLIGGGSRMAPLMAMLRHRAAHPDAHITAHVLVSNRSATAAFYTTELETLTPRERLHVARTYTRQARVGRRGWTRSMDDAMLRAAGPPDDAAKAASRAFVRVRRRPDAVRRDGHAPARRPGLRPARDPRRGLRHPGGHPSNRHGLDTGRCRMKAIVVTDEAAGTAGMSLVERPEPPAATNDVVVQVHASGSTPGELTWPPTWTDRAARDRTPSIPGHELAGVLSALGYGTRGLSQGQRVSGPADWHRDGTLAEYVAVEARNLAPLPGDVDFTVGASLPISGLTAWQGLPSMAAFRRGRASSCTARPAESDRW
jgi:hypothetical protein